ncbi:maleylpyruvate isomerase N-terminal domain-containing protein [Goodfellowiella coeruleoviolacea]|uniref:Mycothiol maleylpyruvate isomerase N-terminal domain-containing protein n=1 Tax=Goodfellowiella coeruleoviolacea TaxID=334858 RepID=A0AAE3GQI3_9PSEU|nr:maleylpyruvate isomerase N-terminal domain-containing protein [Goodfellowiella coeruleoviolacea]MCP2170308.1 Mycothiol maleylpyruvate isomerase N-terminal domain-containing protein [Goodfellowiella coeruleoviolacea]
MRGTDVRHAAERATGFLTTTLDRDWSAPIPGLDMSVAEVVAHVGDCLLWYPFDLTAGRTELSTVELEVRRDSGPADLVTTLGALARVLASVVDGSAEQARGFHPWGVADPAGFAAMACDEILVHTDDAARGLGLRFTPPAELAAAVLRRLFPWAPPDGDPWQVLLWANGRIDLPGRPRQVNWRWHSAPLSEWDGKVPSAQS